MPPAPAAGGWGAAFLAQNATVAGNAQAAVQSEIDKQKGLPPQARRGLAHITTHWWLRCA